MKVCCTCWKTVCVTESNVVPWRKRIYVIGNMTCDLDWCLSTQLLRNHKTAITQYFEGKPESKYVIRTILYADMILELYGVWCVCFKNVKQAVAALWYVTSLEGIPLFFSISPTFNIFVRLIHISFFDNVYFPLF